MRKLLVTLTVCLSFSVIDAASSHYYLLATSGKGSGFSITGEGRPIFNYSQKIPYGLNVQMPFQWNKLLDIAILIHNKTKETSIVYSSIKDVSPTGSIEIALKKPLLKIKLAENFQLKPYVKGGAWGSIARLYSSEGVKPTPLPNGGGLVGVGCQSEFFSRFLVDFSLNKLFSVAPERNSPWYWRIAIGPRL